MGNNSIRSNLSKDTIISEIRLSLSFDISNEYVHMIVEGNDDFRFLKSYVSDKVIFYESFSGKLGVIDIVSSCVANNVIGICDRDYDVDCGDHTRIFFYDTSSLETMLIANFQTFSKACNALDPTIADHDSLHKYIFEELRWLSLFRKIDSNNEYHINFKAISINKAFDNKKKKLNIDILISQIAKANRNFFDDHTDILDIINKKMENSVTYEQLILDTRGHDCLEMFHCLLKPINGKDNFNNYSLLSALICAYSESHFLSSNLCKSLCSYGYKYNLKII